jgi:hypothetical protein
MSPSVAVPYGLGEHTPCPRACLIDIQCPSLYSGPLKPSNRGLGLRGVGHLDEAKAARATGVPILMLVHYPRRIFSMPVRSGGPVNTIALWDLRRRSASATASGDSAK